MPEHNRVACAGAPARPRRYFHVAPVVGSQHSSGGDFPGRCGFRPFVLRLVLSLRFLSVWFTINIVGRWFVLWIARPPKFDLILKLNAMFALNALTNLLGQ